MGLRYATVTGVARDDLDDEGAWLYAETVRADPRAEPRHRRRDPRPRLLRRAPSCCAGVRRRPAGFAHNLETVPRIFKRIRPAFRYERILDVLTQGRASRHGDEVEPHPRDGRDPRGGLAGAARPARGRLRPRDHHAVPPAVAAAPPGGAVGAARGVRRAARGGRRDRLRRRMSGPLVRSSYRAGRLWAQAMRRRGEDLPPLWRTWRTPGRPGRRRPVCSAPEGLRAA